MESIKDIRMIPALPPPPGSKSNFIDPVDHGVIYIAVGSVGLVLVVLFVLLRLYVKVWILRLFGWDDSKRSP